MSDDALEQARFALVRWSLWLWHLFVGCRTRAGRNRTGCTSCTHLPKILCGCGRWFERRYPTPELARR